MAFTPVSGTAGRVKSGSSAVAGIKSWKINKRAAEIPYPHFELTADSDGTVWNTFLKGLADATADIEGWYDTNSTTKTEGGTPAISVGLAITVDLLFDKAAPFGYTGLVGFITAFGAGTAVENQVANFTATIRFTGTVAKAA